MYATILLQCLHSHCIFVSTINRRQVWRLPKLFRYCKASWQATSIFPPLGHTASQKAEDRSAGVGQNTPSPLQKAGTDPITYLESITIHFVVLWVHVAEAAMPTQGGPFTTAGEAFWPNCSGQRSVQRYLKQSKQGKAIPSPAPSPGQHAKGAFSLHARPPHPPLAHEQPLQAGMGLARDSQPGAALQQTVSICAQRRGTACSELTAFLLLMNISCFHFFTSTHCFQFKPPACSFLLQLRAQPQVGFPSGSLPLDRHQTFSRMCSLDIKHQARKTAQKAQQLTDLSFSRASGAASEEVREQETPLHSLDTGETPVQGKHEIGVSCMNLTLGNGPEHGESEEGKGRKRAGKSRSELQGRTKTADDVRVLAFGVSHIKHKGNRVGHI